MMITIFEAILLLISAFIYKMVYEARVNNIKKLKREKLFLSKQIIQNQII